MLLHALLRTHAWLQAAHGAVLEQRRVPLRLDRLRTHATALHVCPQPPTGAAMLKHSAWILAGVDMAISHQPCPLGRNHHQIDR